MPLTITDDDEPLTLTGPKNQVYTVDAAATLTLPAAIGGTGPHAYTPAPLPAGLSFDGDTRVLSGTPTTPGRTRVTYTARDAADPPATATRTFTMRIKRPAAPGARRRCGRRR